MADVKTVGVVGDGLSSLAAVYNITHQLSDSEKTILNVKVIGPHAGGEDWGKGPAYSSPGDLNVTTEKMGFTSFSKGVPDVMTPAGFQIWLNDEEDGYPALLRGEKGRRLQEKAQEYESLSGQFEKGTYLPRRLEGLYIEDIAEMVKEEAVKKGVNLTFHTGKAVDADAERKAVILEGEEIPVDTILDATGNGTLLANIPMSGDISSEAVINNPWADLPDAIKQGTGPIVIYGTGPSFVDKMKELDTAGYFERGGKVIAISRHAFMPLPHAREESSVPLAFTRELGTFSAKNPITAKEFKDFVEKWTTEQNDGQNMDNSPALREGWQDVMTKIRAETQKIWSHLPENEKTNFLDNYFGHWKALRNRMVPEDHERLTDLIGNGQLELRPGSNLHLASERSGVAVYYHARRHEGLVVVEDKDNTIIPGAQAVINCTGPSRDLENGQAWHQNLLRKGMIEKGPAGAGMRLADDGFSAAGSQGFILPVSGELLIGEKFEINGWQDLRKWVESQAGHTVDVLGLSKSRQAALPPAKSPPTGPSH